MKTNTRKRISLILVLAMVLTLAIGSLAMFSDKDDLHADATAGTLDLQIATTEELTAQLVGADSIDNWNPGDSANFTYTLSNAGNKNMRVQEVITLTVTGVEEAGLADCMLTIDGTGVTPAHVSEADSGKYTLTYIVNEFDLTGKVGAANAETIEGKDDTEEKTYTLAFNVDALNEYQAADIDIDVQVVAIQKANSGSVAQNEVYKFAAEEK